MLRGFFKLPSVISGKASNLLPASVFRAAKQPLGLRDRIRAAQGVTGGVSKFALSQARGQPITASTRHRLTASRLSPKFW